MIRPTCRGLKEEMMISPDLQKALKLLEAVNGYETRMTMGPQWVAEVDELLDRYNQPEDQNGSQERT